MRFTKYLNELSMSREMDIKLTHSDKTLFLTEWYIGEQKYEFKALNIQSDFPSSKEVIEKSPWKVEFFPVYPHTDKELDMSETLQLFSAVAKSLKMFIAKKHPTEFYFSPMNEKLRKLYVRFAKKIAGQLKGYNYKKVRAMHTYTIKEEYKEL